MAKNTAKLSTDNRFFRFMDEVGDWIILNMLFILTSLPLITVGMSLTALYKVALRKCRGEATYIAREYFQACKEEWKKGTLLWLLFFFTGALLVFDILYTGEWGVVFSLLMGCLMVIWIFLFSYAFPLQARFENSFRNTLKNSLLLSIKYFPYTLVIVALNMIPVICFAAGTFVTMMAVPIYCFIGIGLTVRVNCFFFGRVFKELM
ncbi:MAG: DUF624 domain-containing protein [Lachnospiraceae bacterium]|nr:DUF624 domain-containing protein [Lachnospiraceae bacterium]